MFACVSAALCVVPAVGSIRSAVFTHYSSKLRSRDTIPTTLPFSKAITQCGESKPTRPPLPAAAIQCRFYSGTRPHKFSVFPRSEIVHIQGGQCGNQIGSKFWWVDLHLNLATSRAFVPSHKPCSYPLYRCYLSGRFCPTSTELTPLEPIMATPTCSSSASTSTSMRPPEVRASTWVFDFDHRDVHHVDSIFSQVATCPAPS